MAPRPNPNRAQSPHRVSRELSNCLLPVDWLAKTAMSGRKPAVVKQFMTTSAGLNGKIKVQCGLCREQLSDSKQLQYSGYADHVFCDCKSATRPSPGETGPLRFVWTCKAVIPPRLSAVDVLKIKDAIDV